MDPNPCFMCYSSSVSLIFRGYAVPFKSILCFCYPMAYLFPCLIKPSKVLKASGVLRNVRFTRVQIIVELRCSHVT